MPQPTHSAKPLFKLLRTTTGEPLLVVQAANHDEAMQRFQLVWSLHRQGPSTEPANEALFTIEQHNPAEPLITPAFLDGWFAVFEAIPQQ